MHIHVVVAKNISIDKDYLNIKNLVIFKKKNMINMNLVIIKN